MSNRHPLDHEPGRAGRVIAVVAPTLIFIALCVAWLQQFVQ